MVGVLTLWGNCSAELDWLGPSLKSWSSSVVLVPKQFPIQWEKDLNHDEILFRNLCKIELSEASPEFATLLICWHEWILVFSRFVCSNSPNTITIKQLVLSHQLFLLRTLYCSIKNTSISTIYWVHFSSHSHITSQLRIEV